MKYELDGCVYFTETERIKKTRIYEVRENGQIMVCIFSSLPYNASEKEIHDYMVSRGAKVVE